MVLTAAFEFDPRSNKEAIIRPTDNIEVPQVRNLGYPQVLLKSVSIKVNIKLSQFQIIHEVN